MKNSKSVVFKRQQALLKELREEKTIDVESVAKKLSVSPTTIRRDLV
ncbi:MAG: DeoR family transcriptional regulator, partial [Selenomonas sp.]|nr:DeoR family transcriptional regulator [Selenomonas sp.]